LFSAEPGIAPRFCIFVRNTVRSFPLSELCSRDLTTVRVTYYRGGSIPPYDSDEPPPSKGLREVVDCCSGNKLQLIVGCDANAHHIIWGSTDVNPQGECLMEYLVSTNHNILNKGNDLL
jgi:splicing factor 45